MCAPWRCLGMTLLKTILVADDDAQARELLTEILSARQDTLVLPVPNGYEALRVLMARRVDLLLTDVRMPQMDGFALARKAKLFRPNVRILYITGCPCAHVSGQPQWPLLRKPVRAAELLAATAHEMEQIRYSDY
jgi:CheY-like chemotaxis protein